MANAMNSESWNQRWSRNDFSPFWLTDEIPAPVIEALYAGLFKVGEPVLEVGCGLGQLAALLAEQGRQVTAIDIAPNAVSRAQSRFGRTDGMLSFLVQDITDPEASIGTVNGAIDRGCFHVLPPKAKAAYATNLAKCLIPGGHFLLMHKTASQDLETVMSEDDVRAGVLQVFERDFDLISREETTFGNQVKMLPGISFVFRRKGPTIA